MSAGVGDALRPMEIDGDGLGRIGFATVNVRDGGKKENLIWTLVAESRGDLMGIGQVEDEVGFRTGADAFSSEEMMTRGGNRGDGRTDKSASSDDEETRFAGIEIC